MLYTSYSKGFKAGGWTTRLSNPLANIDDAQFGPEKARTVELGVKSQFLNRHLQLNAAVFDSEVHGYSAQHPGSSFTGAAQCRRREAQGRRARAGSRDG